MITLTDTQWQEYEQARAEMTRRVADLTSQLDAAVQQIGALTGQLDAAAQQIVALTGQLDGAHKRVAELEAQKKPPPPFVKANRPERGTKVRKKRAPEHHHARQREEPAQMVTHGIERCPECQGRLSGPQDQWWQLQSARQPHPHGPRQSHADLARSRSQSVPPISRPSANSFSPTLNSYRRYWT